MSVAKSEIERRLHRFMETCRQNGMKITHQRMEVFRELAGTDEHPEAETIYRHVHKRIPAISRDTVYRTLASLENCGIVRKAEVLFGKGRYDANMDRHHHFICRKCGLIRDFHCETMDDLTIPKSVASLGRVDSWHVQLQGICAACARRK